jgi:hypothetical protein
MARISEQVLAGLARPQMAQGMFDLGAAIGRVPGQMKQKRQEEQFNEIMKRGQAAMSSAEPDPVVLSGIAQELSALGYTKEAQQFADASRKRGETAAARARAGGLLTQAGTRDGITPKYGQDFLASGGTLEQLQQGQQLAGTLAEPRLERGRGELKAMAMQTGFNEQKPNMINAYLGMADAFGVSRSEAIDILTDAKGLGKKRVVKTGTAILRDSIGNKFEEITTTFADGVSKKTILPVSGNKSGTSKAGLDYTGEEPVGDTTIISRTSGVGGEDRPRLAGDVREEQDFATLKVEASDQILDLVAQRDNLTTAVNLLDTFQTDGLPEKIANFIQIEGGIQDPNKAEYELIVGEAMYSRLKPLFGGVISEGEREAVEGLYANLKRGNPANKRILLRLKTIVDRSIQKQNLLRNSETLADYNRKLNKFFTKTGKDNYIAPPEETEEKSNEGVVGFFNPETGKIEY